MQIKHLHPDQKSYEVCYSARHGYYLIGWMDESQYAIFQENKEGLTYWGTTFENAMYKPREVDVVMIAKAWGFRPLYRVSQKDGVKLSELINIEAVLNPQPNNSNNTSLPTRRIVRTQPVIGAGG